MPYDKGAEDSLIEEVKKMYEKPMIIARGDFRKETAGIGRILRDRVINVGRWLP
ncbi:keywimysin-related RiPP [Corynebacterium cystitidis]|uniref:keywimysin-related RiPP n=1 Tax=Corynebacterium cystitidis TaxID=35757 RepID=UPI00211DC17E|nr:keywimysin-related RiPP [Corynebacterium cystitidis]